MSTNLINFNDSLNYFYTSCNRKVIIDTNLFLLLLIGSTDINFIKKFNRTKMFTIEDFKRLVIILKECNEIFVIPHISTEVSNILGRDVKNESLKKDIFNKLNEFLSSDIFTEECIGTQNAIGELCFHYLGITDAAILNMSKNRLGVITKDFQFIKELEENDVPVINFNKLMDITNMKLL